MTFMFFWHIPNLQYGRVSFDTCSHRRAGAARVRMPEGFGSAWTKDRHTFSNVLSWVPFFSQPCVNMYLCMHVCVDVR